MRILYVEDNATNVILVQRVANMGKHEVINYDNGQTALDHFEQDKPNLVLLDVQLRGGLTGLDVAHTLRTKGCNLPVIAVTAYAMKGDRQRCLDAGCDDYIPKPISVAELVTVFKRYGDAVASGKPIISTFKLQPAATPALASPMPSPVVLMPTSVIASVEVKPAAADAAPSMPSQHVVETPSAEAKPAAEASSTVTPSSSLQPAVETPSAEIKPAAEVSSPMTPAAPSHPVTEVEPIVVPTSSDPLAHRTPTPMNAEP